jgi:hypothetical protein
MARQRESFAWQWHVAKVRIITMSGEDIGWLQTKSPTVLSFSPSSIFPYTSGAKSSSPGFCKADRRSPASRKARHPWCGEDQPSAPPLQAS